MSFNQYSSDEEDKSEDDPFFFKPTQSCREKIRQANQLELSEKEMRRESERCRANLKKSRDPKSQEASFIREQANMSRAEARTKRDNQLRFKQLEMPLRFESKAEYVEKLKEFLMTEAECESLDTELIAQSNVYFEFEERQKIYSRLCLQVPKEIHAHIREHVILSVAIIERQTGKDYVGTGVVKKVKPIRNSPNLQVTLQIDVMYPLNKQKRQKTPSPKIQYMNRLDFRVRYDSSNVFSQIRSVDHTLDICERDIPQGQRLVQECIYKAEP